jgi:5-methylcytosine-specific restriction protein B
MTNDANDTFVLKGRDAEAIGTLVEDGFIVKAGAMARKEIVPSAVDSVTPRRERLIAEGILEERNGELRFTQDYTFDSPSGAAAAVLGRTANGWVEWKHSDVEDAIDFLDENREVFESTIDVSPLSNEIRDAFLELLPKGILAQAAPISPPDIGREIEFLSDCLMEMDLNGVDRIGIYFG